MDQTSFTAFAFVWTAKLACDAAIYYSLCTCLHCNLPWVCNVSRPWKFNNWLLYYNIYSDDFHGIALCFCLLFYLCLGLGIDGITINHGLNFCLKDSVRGNLVNSTVDETFCYLSKKANGVTLNVWAILRPSNVKLTALGTLALWATAAAPFRIVGDFN